MGTLERIRSRSTEISKGMDDANERGEGIARQEIAGTSALEGITVPEEINMQAVKAAMQANLEEAREAFRNETESKIESLSAEGEQLQAEAQEGSRETQEGMQGLDAARDATPYGAGAIESARGGMEQTRQSFDSEVERSRSNIERSRQRAPSAFDSMR